MAQAKTNKNLFRALNKKCLSALEKITNGPLAFKSGQIIQYIPLNVNQDDKVNFNWYVDKERIRSENPQINKYDWFIRQYLYATTQTSLFNFKNIENSKVFDFQHYFDWNIDCLELIYRRANMNLFELTGEIQGHDKEIFILGRNVTGHQILENQYLKSPYTIKNICIQNTDQLKLTNGLNDDFKQYLKQNNIKLIQFENKLSKEKVLEFIKYQKGYQKIFVEDDILTNELSNKKFPFEYKSDILLIGYNTQNQDYFNKIQKQNLQAFPNFSDLFDNVYQIQCAKQIKSDFFITLEKNKDQRQRSEVNKENMQQDKFLQLQIQLEAQKRVQKNKTDQEKQEREEYRQKFNLKK